MKLKKYIITIFLALLTGFLLSKYFLKQYDDGKLIPVTAQDEKLYLIQQGVYSSIESIEENTKKLNYYVYNQIDKLYHVYICMTLDSENANKLKEYYKNNGINTIIKEMQISNDDLINNIKVYDTIIKNTNDNITIKESCKQILSKYEGS